MALGKPTEFIIRITRTNNKPWYSLLSSGLPAKFAAPLIKRGPAKLYAVCNHQELIYVGITKQPMASRIGYGFRANGSRGYHGYKWREPARDLRLLVWVGDREGGTWDLDAMEKVEAEVAFQWRRDSNQWPRSQNEIHFSETDEAHRDAAAEIIRYVCGGSAY